MSKGEGALEDHAGISVGNLFAKERLQPAKRFLYHGDFALLARPLELTGATIVPPSLAPDDSGRTLLVEPRALDERGVLKGTYAESVRASRVAGRKLTIFFDIESTRCRFRAATSPRS
jgi:hypothetical protein